MRRCERQRCGNRNKKIDISEKKNNQIERSSSCERRRSCRTMWMWSVQIRKKKMIAKTFKSILKSFWITLDWSWNICFFLLFTFRSLCSITFRFLKVVLLCRYMKSFQLNEICWLNGWSQLIKVHKGSRSVDTIAIDFELTGFKSDVVSCPSVAFRSKRLGKWKHWKPICARFWKKHLIKHSTWISVRIKWTGNQVIVSPLHPDRSEFEGWSNLSKSNGDWFVRSTIELCQQSIWFVTLVACVFLFGLFWFDANMTNDKRASSHFVFF